MRRKFADFNYITFFAMLLLIATGTVAIWSAGHAREVIFHGMWLNNIQSAAVGLAVYFALALFDYRKYLPITAPFAYLAAVLMLVMVLLLGSEIYGGKRWLWFFQPSEISKLCVIAFLAQLFGRDEDDIMGGWFRGFKGFLVGAILAAVPIALILIEPDLGTALVLAPAIATVLLAAGVWRKGLLTIIALGALAAALLLGAVYEAEKPGQSDVRREQIERWLPLRPHQLKRVKTFLFPDTDPTGAGYNGKQAMIAIASGGFSGKGIGKGETNALQYLPQSVSMNDFIFCVYAEETGYIGALVLLGLFAALCLSGVWTAYFASDLMGRLLSLGVVMLIFAHVYINIAMSIGLVPITGLPLPFISSGRTFLLTVMAALGLTQSVAIHREEQT